MVIEILHGRLFINLEVQTEESLFDFQKKQGKAGDYLTLIDIQQHWFDGDYILQLSYTREIFQTEWNSKAKESLQQFLDLPDSCYDFRWTLYDKSDIHNPILAQHKDKKYDTYTECLNAAKNEMKDFALNFNDFKKVYD